MTFVKTISVGDRFVVTHEPRVASAWGNVIALTDEPGKMIGFELDEEVGIHSCDGRGKNGYCVWATPEMIYTESEWEAFQAEEAARLAYEASKPVYKEFKQINLN